MNRFLGHLLAASIMSMSAGAGILHSQTSAVYPLQVGNRWDYTFLAREGTWESSVVYDTLMPNGHIYAGIHDATISAYMYERQSGSKVYLYDQWRGTESLRYDFALSPGDTVLSQIGGPGDTLDIVLVYDSMASLFGRSLRQWGFWVRVRNIPDLAELRVITDSLGLTHLGEAMGDFDLRGAVLNGVTYGIIADMVERNGPVPLNPKLEQNYPNPFNPSTVISYALPSRQNVRLSVYDILGREVLRLVDESQEAGYKSVSFNASNLPSGIYTYRLTAGTFTQVKKMLYLK